MLHEPKWSHFQCGCLSYKQIILQIAKRFLISTCSKDQGHLPLKYKHVTCAGHSSYLHISCSTYLCSVQSTFATQTRVPLPSPPPPLPSLPLLRSQSTWPRTELENRNLAAPRIFQAGNIPNRETRTAKTNLTGKETEIALISLLSSC